MAANESKKRKAEEYEMQLFGFHTTDVYTTLRDTLLHQLNKSCNKLMETLSNNVPEQKLPILKQCIKTLKRSYKHELKKHLPHIEETVKNTFGIPENVLLDQDADQIVQYTDEEVKSLENSLENLRLRTRRAMFVKAALKQELEILDEVEESAAQAKRWCTLIEKGSQVPKVKNIEKQAEEYKNLRTTLQNTLVPKQIYNPE